MIGGWLMLLASLGFLAWSGWIAGEAWRHRDGLAWFCAVMSWLFGAALFLGAWGLLH